VTPRYQLTAPAERDLEDIFFEVKERHGRLVAERVYSNLLRTFDLLDSMPEMGRHRPELWPPPIGSGPRAPRSSRTERMSDPFVSYGSRERLATGAASRLGNEQRNPTWRFTALGQFRSRQLDRGRTAAETHADGGDAALELRRDKLYADCGGRFERAPVAHAGAQPAASDGREQSFENAGRGRVLTREKRSRTLPKAVVDFSRGSA